MKNFSQKKMEGFLKELKKEILETEALLEAAKKGGAAGAAVQQAGAEAGAIAGAAAAAAAGAMAGTQGAAAAAGAAAGATGAAAAGAAAQAPDDTAAEASPEENQPVPDSVLEITMKAGKGYAWLAGAINKRMDGIEGYTKMSAADLNKRMGGQMLYRKKVYTFSSKEILSGAALSGGMSPKQIAKAQKAAKWWKETGRDQWLAEQSEKEAAKKMEQEQLESLGDGGMCMPDGSTEYVDSPEEENMSVDDSSHEESGQTIPHHVDGDDHGADGGDHGDDDHHSLAHDVIKVTDGLHMAHAAAETVVHGGQAVSSLGQHAPHGALGAAGKVVGPLAVVGGALEINEGLNNPDAAEGAYQVTKGTLLTAGGVGTTAAAFGVGGSTAAAAGPVTAAAAGGMAIGHHGDNQVKERGWLKDEHGNSESASDRLGRHMYENDRAVAEATGSEALGTVAAVATMAVELPAAGVVATAAAVVDGGEAVVDGAVYVGGKVADLGEDIADGVGDALDYINPFSKD